MSKDLLPMIKQYSVLSFVLFLNFFLFATPSFAKRVSYKKALKQHTESQEIYQREDFHASLSWHATWLKPAFLEAMSYEHAKIYNLNSNERITYLKDLQREYADFDVFFVSFYSYDRKESDLASLRTVWKLRLEGEGDQYYSPAKFEKVAKPNTYLKRMFPYINTWSNHYYVFFPKSGFGKSAKLSVRGPTGKGHLTWKIAE